VTRTSTVREIVLRSKVQLINEFQTRFEAYRMNTKTSLSMHTGAPSLGATGDVIRLLHIFVDMKAAAALSAY
jgi:hypothetical protein